MSVQKENTVRKLEQKLQSARTLNEKHTLLQTLTVALVPFDYDKAQLYSSQAFEVAREMGDDVLWTHTLVVKGVIHNHNAEYGKPLDMLFDALKLARDLDSKHVESQALNNISASYRSLENYPKQWNMRSLGCP